MCAINSKHKDRLFCFIFGREENKKWSLDLYNAINNTNYTNINDVQIFTIENVLYMGMKNDVALIVDDILSVYEQQSTFNPNMPVRELIYVSKLYNKYIKANRLNIYSDKLIKLPIPKLVVFYNGEKEKEDTILRLSDSFTDNSYDTHPDISVNVKMININYGKNTDILKQCKILEEYSWFIDKIRKYSISMEVKDAVNRALNEMDNGFSLKPYLLSNKAEVTDMCITEYNEEETLKAISDEKFAEGKAIGKAEGKAEGKVEGKVEGKNEDIAKIKQLVELGKISEEDAQLIINTIQS